MAAESLIMDFEAGASVPLKAYRDSVGKWTIGYGSTYNYLKERPVQEGDIISLEDAKMFLKKDIDDIRSFLLKVVKRKLLDNEMDALVSFVYNIGKYAFLKSTMLFLLNSNANKKLIADEFLKWTFANKKKSEGLLRRRIMERKIFLGI